MLCHSAMLLRLESTNLHWAPLCIPSRAPHRFICQGGEIETAGGPVRRPRQAGVDSCLGRAREHQRCVEFGRLTALYLHLNGWKYFFTNWPSTIVNYRKPWKTSKKRWIPNPFDHLLILLKGGATRIFILGFIDDESEMSAMAAFLGGEI